MLEGSSMVDGEAERKPKKTAKKKGRKSWIEADDEDD